MWCNGCAARWCTAQKKCTGWCGRTYTSSPTRAQARQEMGRLAVRRAEEAVARLEARQGLRLPEPSSYWVTEDFPGVTSSGWDAPENVVWPVPTVDTILIPPPTVQCLSRDEYVFRIPGRTYVQSRAAGMARTEIATLALDALYSQGYPQQMVFDLAGRITAAEAQRWAVQATERVVF